MQRTIDIGPTLLPWHRAAVEAYYGTTRERIEQALADLSRGFWRAIGVAVPQPSAHGCVLLGLGQAVHTLGLLCVLSMLPFAIALFVLAAMGRPDDAIVALLGTCAAALGSLLAPAGMAMVRRAKRLLARLPLDLAVRPASARDPGGGRQMRRLALALDVGFVVIVVIVAALLALGDPAAPAQLLFLPSLPSLLVFAAATLLLGTLVLAGSIALFRRGLATSQPTGRELMARDRRKPVLLLRSFGDDNMSVVEAPTLGQIKALARMEESIAEQFRPFGPLVAIGKPGEALPELGASRDYYSDSEWRAAALELMQEAALIVVIAGVSPGLRWELEAIARAGHDAGAASPAPLGNHRRRAAERAGFRWVAARGSARIAVHACGFARGLHFAVGAPELEERLRCGDSIRHLWHAWRHVSSARCSRTPRVRSRPEMGNHSASAGVIGAQDGQE